MTSVMLRAALRGSVCSVPLAALAGVLARGERGAGNAAAGAITAVVFLTAGLAAIGPVVRGSAGLVVPASLVVHATLLALLFGVLRRIDAQGSLDREVFALAAASATLAWEGFVTWAYAHARHGIYEPGEGGRR